jgi:pimeloyl-ACP methyl ester carboxylesterase
VSTISTEVQIAVFPYGHGRKSELTSLGWRGQIEDMASMPGILTDLGYAVDESKVYAVGISMGAMESLLLAGIHPGFLAGVVAFNTLADLSAWYEDAGPNRPDIEAEVGGTPEELPEEYAARSPIEYAATIARTPVLIYWDSNDEVVPEQDEEQSGLLLRRIKESDPDAPIVGEKHKRGHFFVRPALALDWLLSRA